jgi:hypothetical protein
MVTSADRRYTIAIRPAAPTNANAKGPHLVLIGFSLAETGESPGQ